MRLGLEISSLSSGHQHRGLGFYTLRLKQALSLRYNLTEFTGKPPKDLGLVHYPSFTLFTLPPKKSEIPFVVTVHDLIPLDFPQHFPPGIKGRLIWQLQKSWLKQASAIITDSQASKNAIIKHTGINSQNIHVIYLAADPVFKPLVDKNLLQQIKHKYHLPEKFVLYVGDLNWNKNILALTQACLQLKYPLVAVGKQAVNYDYDHRHPENQDLASFQQLAKKHPRQIICPGFVLTKDLVSIYNLATCYAQPSRAEGFGLPVLEAMASGCPVITSKTTSLAEISGQAALLINPNKKTELSSTLQQCWQSTTLRIKLSKLGLSQVKQFSWQKTAGKTYEVYQSIYEKAQKP